MACSEGSRKLVGGFWAEFSYSLRPGSLRAPLESRGGAAADHGGFRARGEVGTCPAQAVTEGSSSVRPGFA